MTSFVKRSVGTCVRREDTLRYLLCFTTQNYTLNTGIQEAFREVVDQFSQEVPGVRNADDKSEDIAAVGNLESGLILEVNEHSAITLFGAVEYRNDSYKIINPRSSDGVDANDPASFSGTSSYIEQVDQINLYLGIEYTHTF